MTHPTQDELLLLAYDELAGAAVARVEAHLAQCTACRAQFTQLDEAQAALDVAIRPRRRAMPWLVAGLATAAVLAGVVLVDSGGPPPGKQVWRPTTEWSATAGYVTGGRTMMEIDAQLTRLEQERYYGLPN